MPNAWDIAAQLGGQVAGTGLGLLLADENDRRQLRQQEKLQKLGIKGSKELTDYNYGKQLKMWHDTNYGAQMEQLEKAGLNPGLIYGMSGGGGATTGSGSGANANQGHAPSGGGEAQAMGIMGAQMGLLAAQTEKTKQETKNLEAQKPGIEKEPALKEAQTQSLLQGVENAKAQKKLTEIEQELKQVQASVSRQTINEQMKTWELTVSKLEQEIQGLKNDNSLTGQQINDKVKLLKLEVANAALSSNNIKASTNKILSEIANNEQTRNLLIQQLWIEREYLSNEKLKTIIMGQLKDQKLLENPNELEVAIPFIGNIGNILQGKGSHTPVKGFRQ